MCSAEIRGAHDGRGRRKLKFMWPLSTFHTSRYPPLLINSFIHSVLPQVLCMALLEELERFLGRDFDSWCTWAVNDCRFRFVMLTLAADRASSNLKACHKIASCYSVILSSFPIRDAVMSQVVKMFIAIAWRLKPLLGKWILIGWDPCSVHGVQNITDNSLRLPLVADLWSVKSALHIVGKLLRIRDFLQGNVSMGLGFQSQ